MLTTDDIALVRTSFVRVAPIQDAAADLFYDRLFAIAPNLRALFPADLRAQKRKLMQMIATAVNTLDARTRRERGTKPVTPPHPARRRGCQDAFPDPPAHAAPCLWVQARQ